jgi:hypothetical protein
MKQPLNKFPVLHIKWNIRFLFLVLFCDYTFVRQKKTIEIYEFIDEILHQEVELSCSNMH